MNFQKFPKIPLDKIRLPNDWDKEKRDRFIKKRRFKVKNKIEIIDSEVQSKTEYVPSVQAKNTIFYNVVDFNSTTFRGIAGFSGATFSGETAFSGVIFAEGADFKDAKFAKGARFQCANFYKEADFSKVSFTMIEFSGVIFSGNAYFKEARFYKGAYFFNTTFNKLADFSMANFTNEAYFSKDNFIEEAIFHEATFTKLANFSNATFHKLAYFKKARINCLLNNYTKFNEYADFRETVIGKLNYKCTSPAIVKGWIDFRNSRISEAHFQDIIFENDVDFSDVKFGVPLEEGKADGKLATVFRFVTFESDAYFIRTGFHNDTAFERIKFKGDANFTDVDFKDFKCGDTKKFSLSYLTFKHLLLSMDDLPDIQHWVRDDKERIQSFADVEEISPSDFREEEFIPLFTVEGLCETINNDKYGISLKSPNNTIEWLNELLRVPHFYDVYRKVKPDSKLPDSIMKRIKKTELYRKKDFKDLGKDEINSIKKLNRLILEITYPQKTPKMQMESLQPLTKVLYSLKDVFRSQNNLSDANKAYYYGKLMEHEDARKEATFGRWLGKEVEWYFCGGLCDYATSWEKIVLWCGGFYLLFVIFYSIGGKLTKTYHEKEDEFRLRLFVLPKKYLFHKSEKDFVPNEYVIDHKKRWGKFIGALKFSMVIFFKIGYIDTKISGKILRGDAKWFVLVEWIIGYLLLAALMITLSNTLTIVHRLISGIF